MTQEPQKYRIDTADAFYSFKGILCKALQEPSHAKQESTAHNTTNWWKMSYRLDKLGESRTGSNAASQSSNLDIGPVIFRQQFLNLCAAAVSPLSIIQYARFRPIPRVPLVMRVTSLLSENAVGRNELSAMTC
ncbi:hypothetical protein E5D57_001809 [Metarhizium anisopliae]|nr:hypothetical protein E5D57_001809 [Metarhizium anisopliae]